LLKCSAGEKLKGGQRLDFKPIDNQDSGSELEKIEQNNYQTEQVIEIRPADFLEEDIIDIKESDLIYEE
jgi:hypothetical protein